MTIVFNNPHGSPVRVNVEDTVVVDKTAEGTTYAYNGEEGTIDDNCYVRRPPG